MNNDTVTWDDVHDEEHDTTEHYRYISNDELVAQHFNRKRQVETETPQRRTIPIGTDQQLPDEKYLKYRRPRF